MNNLYWLLWRLWHAPFYVLPDAWRGWRDGYRFWRTAYLRWIGLAYWAEIFRERRMDKKLEQEKGNTR